eukprot:g14029.t2
MPPPPTTTAGGAEKKTASPQRASSKSTEPSQSTTSAPAGGQLPDDDFATFPPLSPDTPSSVMGVDVFDLPPRGIPASERGQEQALPSQVLECIRNRHGLEEFAGGRRLLDPKYGTDEDGGGGGGGGGEGSGGGAGLLFPGLRLLHAEPPVVGVDDFFTAGECEECISRSVSPPPPATAPAPAGRAVGEKGPHMQRSATLGADVDAVAQRTSTTWFHRFSAVPELMAKASALVGVPFEEGRWEEAQTVRYRPGEKFTWHLDALPPTPELAAKGGQRIATPLVYSTSQRCPTGTAEPPPSETSGRFASAPASVTGIWLRFCVCAAEMQCPEMGTPTHNCFKHGTSFQTRGLLVSHGEADYSTRRTNSCGDFETQLLGSALLFFPSCGGAADCPFDIRTLHAGEVVRQGAAQDKWIAQLWLRESRYTPTVPKETCHADAESAVAEFNKSWRAS